MLLYETELNWKNTNLELEQKQNRIETEFYLEEVKNSIFEMNYEYQGAKQAQQNDNQ